MPSAMTETDDIVARLNEKALDLLEYYSAGAGLLLQKAASHITRLEERCAALDGQVEAGAAEIERQRELFRLDGEGHASYVRDLTNKHEVRITKYAERIGEMMHERDAARREIRQMEEFIGRREDDILHIARENAALKEEVARKDAALKRIAEKHHRSAELAKEALQPHEQKP